MKVNIKFIFFTSIFSLFTFACKNNNEVKLTYTESDTIKEIVKEKESNISWTKEIEGNRLTESIMPEKNQISIGVVVNPDVLKIIPEFQEPVYPEYKNFGKLDTRLLKNIQKEKIEEFCNSVCKNPFDGPQNYIQSTYLFNYIFFKNDLILNWKTYFNEDFPLTEEYINDCIAKEEDYDYLFSGFESGEPFIGLEIIQIPVRFYCNRGIVDVTLYLTNSSNNEIYQITIDRWEKV